MARRRGRSGAGESAPDAPVLQADDGALFIHGLNAAREAAQYNPGGVLEAWVEKGRRDARTQRLLDRLERTGVPIHRVARSELDRRTGNAVHQGVVIRYQGLEPQGEAALYERLDAADAVFLLVLDQVQDPHNLGACLRSAAAAGVDGVVIPRDRAVGLTAGVFKTAAGALEHVSLYQVTNLARTLDGLGDRGVWRIGAAGEEGATECYDVDWSGSIAVVLGGEEKGLRRLTRKHCDVLTAIPMADGVESLNVSVATGVLLFEARRQRRRSV